MVILFLRELLMSFLALLINSLYGYHALRLSIVRSPNSPISRFPTNNIHIKKIPSQSKKRKKLIRFYFTFTLLHFTYKFSFQHEVLCNSLVKPKAMKTMSLALSRPSIHPMGPWIALPTGQERFWKLVSPSTMTLFRLALTSLLMAEEKSLWAH